MKPVRLPLLALLAALAAFLALPSRPALGFTYVVDRTDDTNVTGCTAAANDCTLRGAINRANISGAGDVISFDPSVFPLNPATATIALGSALPTMTGGSDTIGAGSQGVIVRGAEPRTFHCLLISSAGNSVADLQLTDCDFAIELISGSSNTVQRFTVYDSTWGLIVRSAAPSSVIVRNKIGTNTFGTDVHPDGGNDRGIYVEGDNNTIGRPNEGNIISGNIDGLILANGASGNAVRGNLIGTDVSGTLDKGQLRRR